MANKGIPQGRVTVPARLAHLPTDPEHSDLPVPYFVGSVRDASGALRPDFRCTDPGARERCDARALCWICGTPLNGDFACVTGPMCLINRISSEPTSHLDCARYAVAACPFLTTPGRKRRDKDLPAGVKPPPAHESHNPGNPGAVLVITLGKRPKRGKHELYELKQISGVEFYRAGKRIYGLDCLAEFTAGAKRLARDAVRYDGPDGLELLLKRLRSACTLLFGEQWPQALVRVIGALAEIPEVRFAMQLLDKDPESEPVIALSEVRP